MHEMQALLLELRLVALEGAGLVPALEELCRAYRHGHVSSILVKLGLADRAQAAIFGLQQRLVPSTRPSTSTSSARVPAGRGPR